MYLLIAWDDENNPSLTNFRFTVSTARYKPINSSFQTDIEAGFSSKTFDIFQNIQNGDKRAGLDDQAKEQIRFIMEEQGCGFDEARMIYNQKRMKCNSIDPKTGKPIDSKAVFFS
ncbi:hypothetical protein PORY_002655 [Pneumocystis oryctolagi]|uniref:Uncharacterized protein n=1 Tax=Pneumocystis oryctolagi TaxID=42067 RepID=A0ACB7C8T9_9ASCO|nr:hypothetical protein PORY_002655 [Pneumocystis oryctolagi]